MTSKLPVLGTVKAALADAIRLVAGMPIPIGLLLLWFAAMHGATQFIVPDPLNARFDLNLLLWNLALSLGSALVSAPVAVLIHRRIILGENHEPRSLGTILRPTFQLFIVLATFRVATKLTIVPMIFDDDSLAAMLASLSIWVVAIYVFVRLTMVFPAIAIDDGPQPVRAGWRASRGVFWRILATVAVSGALVLGSFWGFGYLAKAHLPQGHAIAVALEVVRSTIWLFALAAVASHIYLWRATRDRAEAGAA